MARGVLLGLILLATCTPGSLRAQDLVERYREARIRRIAREQAERSGLRLVARPPSPVEVPGDTIRAFILSHLRPRLPEVVSPEPPAIVIDSVRVIRKLEAPAFADRFEQAAWAFYQGHAFERLDTTRTIDLRARLEAHFGPPTHTLAEMDSVESRPRDEIVQFEYWMIVNDSIPVLVLDANGFIDRGLVLAAESKYRPRLADLRKALLGPLEDPTRREPYVDYYYQVDSRSWFVSGFDGASFFTRRIERPDLSLGRPYLGTYAPAPSER